MNFHCYPDRLFREDVIVLGDVMRRQRRDGTVRMYRFVTWSIDADGRRTGVFEFMDGTAGTDGAINEWRAA